MANGKRVLILNRWRDEEFTAYHDHIDHTRHRVSYVTTTASRHVLRGDLAAGIYEVDSLEYSERLLEAARAAAAAQGGLDVVIALAEADLETAALVRQTLGVPGDDPRQARLYRDKVEMKQRLDQAGIRTPRFIECTTDSGTIDFARRVGFPVMLKPRRGAASRGVFKAHSEAQLVEFLRGVEPANYECEEFITGEMLLADGLVHGGSIAVFQPSLYLGTCYDFSVGEPVGSIHLVDQALGARVRAFTQDVLTALGHARGAFHLELFLDRNDELVFCEIGARVGGAEIPYLFRDVLGVLLLRECLRLEVEDWSPPSVPSAPQVGGALLFPPPQPVPSRVVTRQSLMGELPSLYAEILPDEGSIIDTLGGYGSTSISGMLLFKAETSAEVERDIRRAVERFQIEATPVASAAALVQRSSWRGWLNALGAARTQPLCLQRGV